MEFTISLERLALHHACFLAARRDELPKELATSLRPNTEIPLQIWWDQNMTTTADMWWSLRVIHEPKEAKRRAVQATIRTIRRALFRQKQSDLLAILEDIEKLYIEGKELPPLNAYRQLTGNRAFLIRKLVWTIQAPDINLSWHEKISEHCLDITEYSSSVPNALILEEKDQTEDLYTTFGLKLPCRTST